MAYRIESIIVEQGPENQYSRDREWNLTYCTNSGINKWTIKNILFQRTMVMKADFQKSDVDHGPQTKNELPFLKPLQEYWNTVKKESQFVFVATATHSSCLHLYDVYLWCLLNVINFYRGFQTRTSLRNVFMYYIILHVSPSLSSSLNYMYLSESISRVIYHD